MANVPPKRKRGNDKRVQRPDQLTPDRKQQLLRQCRYEGHPEHKSSAGDFGLTPPASPNFKKTLCNVEPFEVARLAEAQALLESGIARAMVSASEQSGLPKYIWCVRANDHSVFEARLGGSRHGRYHGYPLSGDDPRRDSIMAAWKDRVG